MNKPINPYTPGAGYAPPYLAGRESAIEKFKKILEQDNIYKNPIFTGLRGVGKTVLLTEIEPIAAEYGWIWVGKEFSESTFVSEESLAMRLLADLSFFTSVLTLSREIGQIGLDNTKKTVTQKIDLNFLKSYYDEQPGLMSDKIQATFEFVWPAVESSQKKGIIFAYDEAQIVSDQESKEQYPLTMMLGLFQSLQKKGMRFMLLLCGLPSLFPKLVEVRTYAERMFTVHTLENLDEESSKKAIEVPLENIDLKFSEHSVEKIIKLSGGYPYFIQFMCRECFDHFRLQQEIDKESLPSVPVDVIMANLDSDFFSGRWETIPERQKELLLLVAAIDESIGYFSSAAVFNSSEENSEKYDLKPFSKGDVSQTLNRLTEGRVIYKISHGKYSFAIPMFGEFIRRKNSLFHSI